MKVQVKPLEGIVLNGKEISLHCSREAVEEILGEPDRWKNSSYYYHNELRFDFNSDNELEFIEFLAGYDSRLQPEVYGICPFRVAADEVYAVLSEHNQGEIDDSENGYSYGFLETSIGVYRPRIPDDVLEMEEEARESGELLSKEEYEYEMKQANYWATFGLGVEGYYK